MNLADIRINIDRVDREIQKLFLERMSLAEQVVSVKAETADKIFKPDREKDIILRNSQNMKPELIKEYQAFVKRIMEVSRKYQYGRMLELRDCFPYQYETHMPQISSYAMLREDISCGQIYHIEEEGRILYDDNATLFETVRDNSSIAGIAVMEQIGRGVKQEFARLLGEYNLYINECLVTRDEEPAKCVAFSRHLVVQPEHNRFKIMFTTRNDVGALGTILSMISDYHVNITEIHSCPVLMDQGWDYQFYLELEGNMDSKEIHSLIFQISEETQNFKILGSYLCEGDF